MSDTSSYSIRSVFHPTDFSRHSMVAFSHALKIALINRSFLDILHVNSKSADGPEWSGFPQVRETLERWALLEKDSPRKAVAEKLGIKVSKAELGSKKPLAAISHFLRNKPTDLIVLATQGREGLPRWLKPSVSERLMRRSNIAALFVPEGAKGFVSEDGGQVGLRRTLIPVDHSPDPQSAVDAAGNFLRPIDGKELLVDVLHVGKDARMPEVAPPSGLNCSFQRSARSGKVVEEIIGIAAETKADLIVMATEGHNGFLDAYRGSTTEQVLRRAPCPVLAVPAVRRTRAQ